MADPGLCEAAELSQGEKKGPSDAADVTFFFFFLTPRNPLASCKTLLPLGVRSFRQHVQVPVSTEVEGGGGVSDGSYFFDFSAWNGAAEAVGGGESISSCWGLECPRDTRGMPRRKIRGSVSYTQSVQCSTSHGSKR